MSIHNPENPTEDTSEQTTTLKLANITPEKSRLETYVDMLAVLAVTNQLKLRTDCKLPYLSKTLENKYALDFLVELGLIKQNAEIETGINYCVTQRGKAVLKYFKYFDNLEPKQRTRALKR